jgi:polysaccharide export outer membrane protein
MSSVRFVVACLVSSSLALAACSAPAGPPRGLPAPVKDTEVGPGDMFEVTVVGEKELPKEYQVQSDGTIHYPYLPRLKVEGLEPAQIEDLLTQKLIEKKILVEPQIIVIVKQYNSKKVTIIGAVSKPGPIGWSEGLAIVDAISQAGWFTPLADSDRVILTRKVGNGKTVTVYVSVDQISSGRQPNIPLQAGDTIKVDSKVW